MSEVSFVKTFLAVLDTKPAKIAADHVEDPRTYHARTPYILPRMPKPMSKPARAGGKAAAPGSERGVTVSVKSLRNPPLDLTLAPAFPPSTTAVLDVKTAVAAQTGLPLDKIKLLYAKKPVPDSKALKDLLSAAGGEAPAAMEFSVMVLGGAAALAAAKNKSAEEDAKMEDAEAATVAQGLSGAAVLETDEFWADLKGFLQQRIRDEKVAEEATVKFKKAWNS